MLYYTDSELQLPQSHAFPVEEAIPVVVCTISVHVTAMILLP